MRFEMKMGSTGEFKYPVPIQVSIIRAAIVMHVNGNVFSTKRDNGTKTAIQRV